MTHSSPHVADNEVLARFLLFRRWFSPEQQRVKPDAFIPHPHTELSVTRHIGLEECELWDLGQDVVRQRSSSGERDFILYGRADVEAIVAKDQRLEVISSEPPRNHANVVRWPLNDKPAQKIIALELAAKAKLHLLSK